MTMKRYHYFGLDNECRKLLKLLSASGKHWEIHHSIRRETAECRIQGGSLFTCQRISLRLMDGRHIRPPFRICPHLDLCVNEKCGTFHVRSSSSRLAIRIKDTSKASSAENIIKRLCKQIWRNLCSDIEQCLYCRTEYLVRPDNVCATKCSITVWKDLGQGLDTNEWKAHLPHSECNSSESRLPPEIEVQKGEIAKVFKGAWGLGGPKVVENEI